MFAPTTSSPPAKAFWTWPGSSKSARPTASSPLLPSRLFTNGLEAFDRAYEEGAISRIISTNLTYRTPELKQRPWFIEADMSKYISYIVASLNHDRSLSSLLNPLRPHQGAHHPLS